MTAGCSNTAFIFSCLSVSSIIMEREPVVIFCPPYLLIKKTLSHKNCKGVQKNKIKQREC